MDIGVLGPVTIDGADLRAPRRDRVVLEVLAMRFGRVVSAEQLADALWADELPASWVKVVQGCIVRLRKALGVAVIETDPLGYRLQVPADAIDASRFERLAARGRELLTWGEPDRAAYTLDQALGLWRGPPLAELEDWEPGRAEALRLDGLRLDAEELRLEAALGLGGQLDVLGSARARVQEAPLRERRWALLALAQYRAGHQAAALRTLHEVRTHLSRELGLDPGPDLMALEAAIRQQDPSLVADVALPAPRPSCPYRGLVPYDVGDAEDFYGRDGDIAACRERLTTENALTVVGPSGSGKSSLVRAGVTAALEREGRRVVVITPGAHPMDALTAVPGTGSPPVLVVDQCEEAVGLCHDPTERAEFFTAITEYAERSTLVVAVRADRLGDLTSNAGFSRLVERSLYLLNPMTADDLVAAIEGPARGAGLRLEGGLVDVLVREVEGEPGALPLLSHALRATWVRREANTLTVAGYRATGGIRGAVAQSAETVYERLPVEQRAALRDLLMRLVAPSPDGDPVRRRLPRRLVAGGHDALIETLVDARLVTTDDGVLELAHEALVRAWPRLHDWLADDAEGQRILRHLVVAADSWNSLGRPDSELYRGVRLANVLEWESGVDSDLTPTEREFLDAGRALAATEEQAVTRQADQQRRVNRRLRALLVGVAALAVLALVLAAVAYDLRGEATDQRDEAASQRDEAASQRDEAAASALAAGSQAVADDNPALALALAAESLHAVADPLPQSVAALARARWALDEGIAQQVREPLAGMAGEGLTSLAFSPDGGWLALGGDDGVRLWRTDSWTPARLGAATGPVVSLQFGPDSAQLATAGAEGVRLFDLRTLEPVGGPVLGIRSARSLAFSSRGVLAIAVPDGPIRLWDAADGREVGEPVPVGGRPVGSLTFDVDGRLLAAIDDRSIVRVWDLSRGRALRARFDVGAESDSVAFGAGGTLVTSGAEEVRLRRWHATSGRPLGRPVRVPDSGAVYAVASSPRTGMVAAGGADGALTLLSREAGAVADHRLGGHVSDVDAVAFSGDGRLLVSADDQGVVLVWALRPHDGALLSLHALEDANAVAISPRGDLLAVAGLNHGRGVIRVWDPVDGRLTGTIRGNTPIRGVAFSPAGDLLASYADDGRVSLWDTDDLAPVAGDELRQRYGAASVAFGPRGELAWGDFVGHVWWWDSASNEAPAGPLAGHRLSRADALAFSPDGKVLAAGGEGEDGALVLWDVATGRPLGPPLVPGGSVNAVAFSPDGTSLAASGRDGTIWIWDRSTGELVGDPARRHGASVTSLAFTPDSQLLATSGADGTLQFWETRTADPVGGPLPGASEISSIAFAGQGRLLATASEDGTVRLWDLNVYEACRIARAYVTAAQVRPHLPPGRQPTCGYVD